MIDLGSGMVIDRAQQRAWGLPDEPTVRETVASGADLVTFSGDKLLGGPQAGIVVGTHAAVERARKHPLMRALRPDKLTLAGLEATLALYRDGRVEDVPAVRMIARTVEELRRVAETIVHVVGGCDHTGHPSTAPLAIDVAPCTSTVGGGAMPTAALPSVAIRLPEACEPVLRAAPVPIIGRVADGRVWLDLRTISDEEVPDVIAAVQSCVRSPA
jgi:L-seryl-tRNA(Ser) seleniumtransferase